MKYYVLKNTVNGYDYQEESYGVLLMENEMKRKYICNVTTDYDKICELVDKMNEFNIESCHSENIIEDFKYTLKYKIEWRIIHLLKKIVNSFNYTIIKLN